MIAPSAQSCWLAEACKFFFFYAAVFVRNPTIIHPCKYSCVSVHMFASLLNLVSTVILVSKPEFFSFGH